MKGARNIMEKISYSILSYFPSIITDENMNVGILFFDDTTNFRSFHMMKNWGRLASFDDELDIDYMKVYLKSLKDQIEENMFSKNTDINELRKMHVNELRFSDTTVVEVENRDDFIELTKKVYMRLDFNKEERIEKGNEIKLAKIILKSKEIPYTSAITGAYEENINYDFVASNYAFKSFAFEDKKDLSKIIHIAKSWSYNADKLKHNYKTVFLYDKDIKDSKNYNIIISILKEHAHDIVPMSDIVPYIKEHVIKEKSLF